MIHAPLLWLAAVAFTGAAIAGIAEWLDRRDNRTARDLDRQLRIYADQATRPAGVTSSDVNVVARTSPGAWEEIWHAS